MKHVKSERLKKFEVELNDLEQWLKLSLVPKKDIEKHKEEIRAVKAKIAEEKDRLQFLKESGDTEEYIAPKRPTGRAAYTEMPHIPDVDIGDTSVGAGDSGFDMESDAVEVDNSVIEEAEDETEETNTAAETKEEDSEEEEEEESYFSDKNRWKRGGIVDPDANEW